MNKIVVLNGSGVELVSYESNYVPREGDTIKTKLVKLDLNRSVGNRRNLEESLLKIVGTAQVSIKNGTYFDDGTFETKPDWQVVLQDEIYLEAEVISTKTKEIE